MKKNKLTLAAGILMVILASLSIVVAIEYVVWFAECVNILLQMINSIKEENISFVLDSVILLGLIMITIAESILYMIWGVKLIKKTNKRVPIANMRKWLITMLVFSYVFAFLHLEDFSTLLGQAGMFLAIAILLTCAVAKGGNTPSRKSATNNNSTALNNESVEKMLYIKKLREEGVISEEEYSKLRDKILKSLINLDDDTQDK